MKKVYIAPTVAAYEICTDGMLALSTINNGGNGGQDLGSGDFGETGDFEICTNKKEGYWDTEW